MKTILLSLFSTVAVLFAAEPSYSPQQALDKFGSFTITNTSSYFTFLKNGSFDSGPLGMSGEQLRGTWTSSDGTNFTVTAKQGWVNGINLPDEYRRVAFRIGTLRKPPLKPTEIRPGVFLAARESFDCDCSIGKAISIPKPKDEKSPRL
jgi:hypothetical protein